MQGVNNREQEEGGHRWEGIWEHPILSTSISVNLKFLKNIKSIS